MTERYYVVAPPGNAYGVPDGNDMNFYSDPERAVGDCDARTKDGQLVQVYQMEPLPEAAHYDWGVLVLGGTEPMWYANEQAARSDADRPGRSLMRRRFGTNVWELAE